MFKQAVPLTNVCVSTGIADDENGESQKVSARAWDWIRSFVFIAVYTLTYGSRPHHQNSGVLGGVEYVN